MPGTLTSKRFKVDDMAAAVDFCFDRGWSGYLAVNCGRLCVFHLQPARKWRIRWDSDTVPSVYKRCVVVGLGRLCELVASNE